MDKKQINETGWKNFVVNNRNITIPKKDTTYWCSLFKAPEFNTKQHITKFEPYVQKGNEGFVHHMLVYECHDSFNDSHYGPGFDCRDQANMPFTKCYFYSIVAAWAIGGEAFYFPTKAGFPIGTDDSPKNYMLEIHYDNPEGIEGRKDSSGFRFHYTPKLRQYDSGVFIVGDFVSSIMVIPPKQESWLTVGYCSKECYLDQLKATQLPGGGVNVFAAFLHTHLQGRATWTKHYRDGVELPEIARDDNYDFNFQDIQVLRREVHIKPGDDLVHYCKYQTMDRDKVVWGGDSTSQEMCVDFLFYYPRMVNSSSYCYSMMYTPVQSFMGKYFPDVNVSWPNPLVSMNVTWTEEMVSDLRRGFDQAKGFIPMCFWGNSPYKWLPIPKVTKPLPPEESKCHQPTPEDPESNSSLVSASCTLVLILYIIYMSFL